MKVPPKLRLFVECALVAGGVVAPSPAQCHYLLAVMRVRPGDAVALFNGRDGEWRAEVRPQGRRLVALDVTEQLRPQADEADLWLLFAPVKRQRIDLIVEKATELGVSALMPVWTRHTVTARVKDERLVAIAVEAAEQCRRLSVPIVHEARALDRVLADWPTGRRLAMLDESGAGLPLAEALATLPPGGPLAVLVGPEGGFASEERDLLASLPFVIGAGLGPRILRADTAAIAALACLQALVGDWRLSPSRNQESV